MVASGGRLPIPSNLPSLGNGPDQHQKTQLSLYSGLMADKVQKRTSGNSLTLQQYSLPGSGAPGVASFCPFLLPVVIIQLCPWAAEESVACCLCSEISGVDKAGSFS